MANILLIFVLMVGVLKDIDCAPVSVCPPGNLEYVFDDADICVYYVCVNGAFILRETCEEGRYHDDYHELPCNQIDPVVCQSGASSVQYTGALETATEGQTTAAVVVAATTAPAVETTAVAGSGSVSSTLSGFHIPGGTLQASVTTFIDCNNACSSSTMCQAFDWDNNACWFHSSATACNLPVALASSTHVSFIDCMRDSNGIPALPAITATVTGSMITSPSPTAQTGIEDFCTCGMTCARTTNCQAFDFDSSTNTCRFVISATCPTPTPGSCATCTYMVLCS